MLVGHFGRNFADYGSHLESLMVMPITTQWEINGKTYNSEGAIAVSTTKEPGITTVNYPLQNTSMYVQSIQTSRPEINSLTAIIPSTAGAQNTISSAGGTPGSTGGAQNNISTAGGAQNTISAAGGAPSSGAQNTLSTTGGIEGGAPGGGMPSISISTPAETPTGTPGGLGIPTWAIALIAVAAIGIIGYAIAKK